MFKISENMITVSQFIQSHRLCLIFVCNMMFRYHKLIKGQQTENEGTYSRSIDRAAKYVILDDMELQDAWVSIIVGNNIGNELVRSSVNNFTWQLTLSSLLVSFSILFYYQWFLFSEIWALYISCRMSYFSIHQLLSHYWWILVHLFTCSC